MTYVKTYVIETEATGTHGCQRWSVRAVDPERALQLFAEGHCDFIEQDIEVTDLGPPEVVGLLEDFVPTKAVEDPELEYLRFFFQNADFGPAHEDVIACIEAEFTRETGKSVPDNYKIGG
jgi:hypothetical protein